MLTEDFDFHLPDDRIAQHPVPRGHSRLLVLDADGEGRHRHTRDLPTILRSGDLLVVNDTRVVPARLFGRRRPGGGKVELLLVEKTAPRTWEALVKPGRRARPGTVIDFWADGGAGGEGSGEGSGEPLLDAEVLAKTEDGRHSLRFSEEPEPHLGVLGHVPLPPYIKRPDEGADRTLYQTVYARSPGAIAAPTAGLHFSDELLDQLGEQGVERATVTLHVGIGTFKPVTAALVHEHRMDSERWEVPAHTAEAIARCRERGGRVVAVGTTVVRTLESAAREGELVVGSGRTELFITPGFRFRVVDALLTNFHLPRSTLLMLVSALAGRRRVLAAYDEAIERHYRFYSYGDAMLLERRDDLVENGP